jgi:hypothetical protein
MGCFNQLCNQNKKRERQSCWRRWPRHNLLETIFMFLVSLALQISWKLSWLGSGELFWPRDAFISWERVGARWEQKNERRRRRRGDWARLVCTLNEKGRTVGRLYQQPAWLLSAYVPQFNIAPRYWLNFYSSSR